MTSENDALSVWKVEVQTQRTLKATAASKTGQTIFTPKDKTNVGIYDPHGNPVLTNEFQMCCYVNIGFEARVGATVERNRAKSRCIMKLYYFLFTAFEGFCKR